VVDFELDLKGFQAPSFSDEQAVIIIISPKVGLIGSYHWSTEAKSLVAYASKEGLTSTEQHGVKN